MVRSRDREAFERLRSGKRTASFGGVVTERGEFVQQDSVPGYLRQLNFALRELFEEGNGGRQPNHLFVNDYDAGVGILPHLDGPKYDPLVAIVSLGTPVVFDFHRSRSLVAESRFASVYLPARSLLVFRDGAYTDCMHGIAFRRRDPLAGVVKALDTIII